MTVYRITSDDNIIRVSKRDAVVKIVNNGRGPRGPQGDPATNLVTSVNGKQGAVVLTTNDVSDISSKRYTNDSDITRLANTSGTNTGDQDLSGYATDSELTTGLSLKENTANKSTDTTLGTSNTLFPTQNAVKTYVDTQDALKVSKSGDTMSGYLDMGSNDLTNARSVQFNLAAGATPQAGQLNWNATEGVLDMGTAFSGVTIQLGMENIVRVRNKTGSTISNGQVVYVNGALGNRPTVALADADVSATSLSVLGIATADIPNNADGAVTTEGIVRDLNTIDYAEGTELYLSQTAGQLTDVSPVSPALSIKVATVTRSHAVQGEVLVHTDHIIQKADIGLGNVDNTSDVNKPVSNATQLAINELNNIAIAYAVAL